MVAILVLFTIAAFIMIDYLVSRRTRRLKEAPMPGLIRIEDSRFHTPGGVYFDPGHTWLYLEESGTARVGVNELARSVVGSIDRITTRPVGDEVRAGDVILRVHHGDRTVEFRSPIDGVVSEINAEPLNYRSLPDADPYTSAWLCKITPRDSSSVRGKMLGEEAKGWLSREVERLKVFLATIVPEHPVLGQTMQDGGLPRSGLIDHLNDADWNKLKQHFFQ